MRILQVGGSPTVFEQVDVRQRHMCCSHSRAGLGCSSATPAHTDSTAPHLPPILSKLWKLLQ